MDGMSHRYTLGRSAMVDWSDRGPGRAPAPEEWAAAERAPELRGPRRGATGGPALAGFVSRFAPTGHVLVAGCLGDDVLDAVATTAGRMTLLVRGTLDAAHLEERYPAATVLCGDLKDLGAALDAPADAAVLLDGLDRITGVESAPDTWVERLAAIQALLAADAPVLLTVANPLSPAALGRIPSERAADSDADWAPVDRTAPATREAALAALPGTVAWSLFGAWAQPSLVLPHGSAPGSGAAALALAHSPTGGVLDERGALRVAADAGRLDEHAPAWLLAPGTPAEVLTLPDGALFEDVFLDASAARDAGAARMLLGAAARLLADGVPALPHTVVVAADETCARLPVELEPTGDPLLAFCAALANRMVQLGVRRPWPEAADRTELARLLAGAAGRDVSIEEVAAVLPPLTAVTPDGVRAEAERTEAVREREHAHIELIGILETRSANLHDQLEARTAALAKARANLAKARANVQAQREQLAEIRGSRSYRIAQAATAPVRKLRRR